MSKMPPERINYDHISDDAKLKIWRQARNKKGVIVMTVGGVAV